MKPFYDFDIQENEYDFSNYEFENIDYYINYTAHN